MILPAATMNLGKSRKGKQRVKRKLLIESSESSDEDVELQMEENESDDDNLHLEYHNEIMDDIQIEEESESEENVHVARRIIKVEEEDIGMFYAIKWLEPRGYHWGRLDLVFSDDVDTDVNTAKFVFLKRKRLSSNPNKIRYELPLEPEEAIVNIDRILFGPTLPEVDKSLLFFETEEEVRDIFDNSC